MCIGARHGIVPEPARETQTKMTTNATWLESLTPRVADLKANLVAQQPIKKPADRVTLAGKRVGEILIQHLTWKARLVKPRPRDVVLWPEVTNSPYHPQYAAAIATIEADFKAGADMNPYLSNLVRSHTYAGDLPLRGTMTNDEWIKKSWNGKDRIRVTVDTHHLHLGGRQVDGTVGRSGPLLFAGITPETAFLITIGDHHSFTDGSISSLMYQKLDAQLAAQGGGVAIAGPMVTLGGGQVKDTMRSIEMMKLIYALDKRLEEEGHAGTATRTIRVDWDDILVLDAVTCHELERIPGKL